MQSYLLTCGSRVVVPFVAAFLVGVLNVASQTVDTAPVVLPGTQPLELTGDIAEHLVAGVDRFLLSELEASVARRGPHWNRDHESADGYAESIEPNRHRLAHILGVRDERVADTEPQLSATMSRPALAGRGDGYEIYTVSWAAFGNVTGRGLIFEPIGTKPVANIVAIPDCSILPEQLAGLIPGVAPESQYARRLAESGCRVVVPMLVNRAERMPNLTNREWLYRSAFELGRGLIGYEVQKVLAVVDWFSQADQDAVPIGVVGWGEGGLISLYAAALDQRIDAACVSGYFDSRQNIWQEPLDRNVFGLLEQFGDAELASMVYPRSLIVEACRAPEVILPGGRGAPARIVTPKLDDVRREIERANQLLSPKAVKTHLKESPDPLLVTPLLVTGDGEGPGGGGEALVAFLRALSETARLHDLGDLPENLLHQFEPDLRHQQQMDELDRHSQHVLRVSHHVRQRATMARFDTSSLEAYSESAQEVRGTFYDDVIGRFSNDVLPANARTRLFQNTDSWTCYEVVLDVYPDVIAYGLLLVPRDITAGERRPVVVCQHGLEGRPQHTIGDEGSAYYAAFAAKLAERGFVTFAPQNLYLFGDRFRTLQRKANPLKKTLFSIITPQHQQIVDWLQTLDFVDPQRIGFYGLSYGGKTAMRVPALVTDYCLSICSADFNEWVDKNASTHNPRSYVGTGEYEIFEFDLGSTFNYAEMAALIAPRPFMVERGHFDGVADDWTVAHEYAKIRHLYAARLKVPERTEIEWFDGPHTINGVGTFRFLHRHLDWPERGEEP